MSLVVRLKRLGQQNPIYDAKTQVKREAWLQPYHENRMSTDMKQMALKREFHKFSLYANELIMTSAQLHLLLSPPNTYSLGLMNWGLQLMY